MCALVRDAEDGEDGDGLGMVRICRDDCALHQPIPQPVMKLASGSKQQVKTMKQLKEALKARGLKFSGTKAELEARLTSSFMSDNEDEIEELVSDSEETNASRVVENDEEKVKETTEERVSSRKTDVKLSKKVLGKKQKLPVNSFNMADVNPQITAAKSVFNLPMKSIPIAHGPDTQPSTTLQLPTDCEKAKDRSTALLQLPEEKQQACLSQGLESPKNSQSLGLGCFIPNTGQNQYRLITFLVRLQTAGLENIQERE